MTSSGPVPSMEGIANFRGIGGLSTTEGRTTAGGLLWRSGHLGRATETDLARLEALAVRTVVDLRTDDDIAADGPDKVPDGVLEVLVPIPDDAGMGAAIRGLIMRGDEDEMRSVWSDGRSMEIAVGGAAMMVTDPGRVAAFAEVFSVVADPGRWPLIWHCSAGKDRAGWVGTALLLLLGVERDAVVAHYLESNRGAEHRVAGLVAAGWATPGAVELMRPFLEVSAEAVTAQIAAVDDHWGGAEAMFRDGFGIGEARIAELRERLLD
ncbi:MAG: tyrosine-protein phosphatase [Actinomycetota bacterium]|nr:tyrosine-protein phosphatase [Actinomycetota bacterium]MEC9394629.1 tyrosine-protein phosphatase [Actinomycetota bacterium]MED6328654.1 tyrosine-protein phosphatase [Actinomycetota bacterium]MEE2957574.1 tyrosine-protein phosphatase [Actinomycetota bacterium]